MLDDLFKRTQHLVQQSVECMLKQTLKPFKQAFTERYKGCFHIDPPAVMTGLSTVPSKEALAIMKKNEKKKKRTKKGLKNKGRKERTD